MTHPTEYEIFQAAKDFFDMQGTVLTRYAFEQGTKWYQSKIRETENEPSVEVDGLTERVCSHINTYKAKCLSCGEQL